MPHTVSSVWVYSPTVIDENSSVINSRMRGWCPCASSILNRKAAVDTEVMKAKAGVNDLDIERDIKLQGTPENPPSPNKNPEGPLNCDSYLRVEEIKRLLSGVVCG